MASKRDLQAAEFRLKAAREHLESERPLYRALVTQKASLEQLLAVVNDRLGTQMRDTRSAISEAFRLLPKRRLDAELQEPELEPILDFSDGEMQDSLAGESDSVPQALRYLEGAMRAEVRLKRP